MFFSYHEKCHFLIYKGIWRGDCEVIDDVITMTNTFSCILWADLFISDVNLTMFPVTATVCQCQRSGPLNDMGKTDLLQTPTKEARSVCLIPKMHYRDVTGILRVSKHRQPYCLSSSLFQLATKETLQLCITGPLYGEVTGGFHVQYIPRNMHTVFVVLCFVVVMQSFIMNSHEVFIHIHQGCFAGTGAIVRLPQCQWSKPDGYGKISQCITTTKHSKAKTVCILLGIYCTKGRWLWTFYGPSSMNSLLECG